MNFYELQAFTALARNLHFAKSASQVNMSPSALSRLVARLEQELGTKLLERDTRQVFLTDEGKHFAQFAQECLDRSEDLQLSFSREKDHVQGTLKVYASVTACYSILGDFVAKFSESYPLVHLSVETGDPAGAAEAVLSHRADVAVSALPSQFDQGLNGTAVFESLETFSIQRSPLVFAAKASGKYGSLHGSIDEIINTVPLILPKTGLARRRFDRHIHQHELHPLTAAETAGNEAILALVQLGLGIGLLPRIVLETWPFASELIHYDAGTVLGEYNIGFILNVKKDGTETSRRLRSAVSNILHKQISS